MAEFKVPGEEKKLYSSAVLDLYAWHPAAYAVSAGNDNRLVFEAFDRAIAAFPDVKPMFSSYSMMSSSFFLCGSFQSFILIL